MDVIDACSALCRAVLASRAAFSVSVGGDSALLAICQILCFVLPQVVSAASLVMAP
jgi:hypothetical protein